MHDENWMKKKAVEGEWENLCGELMILGQAVESWEVNEYFRRFE